MGNKHSRQQPPSNYTPYQYQHQYQQYQQPQYQSRSEPINTHGTPEYIADRQNLCATTIKRIENYLVNYTEENIKEYTEAIQKAKAWVENNKTIRTEYEELKKFPAILNIDQLQKYTMEGIEENELMLEKCNKFLEKINVYLDEYQELTRYNEDWYKVNRHIGEVDREIDILVEYYNERPVIHTEELTIQIQQLSDKMAMIQSMIIESGISEITNMWRSCISPSSINYGVKNHCFKLTKNITTIKDMIKLIDLEEQEFM